MLSERINVSQNQFKIQKQSTYQINEQRFDDMLLDGNKSHEGSVMSRATQKTSEVPTARQSEFEKEEKHSQRSTGGFDMRATGGF